MVDQQLDSIRGEELLGFELLWTQQRKQTLGRTHEILTTAEQRIRLAQSGGQAKAKPLFGGFQLGLAVPIVPAQLAFPIPGRNAG